MFRILGALSAALIMSLGLAGTASAADTGPDSAACATAKSSVVSVQTQVNDAQKAYDVAKADSSTATGVLQGLLDTLNGLKVTLGEKKATETRACRSGGGNGNHNPRPNLPRYNDCHGYNSHGIFDLRRGDSRFNDAWDRNRNGIACDRDDVIVTNGGDCVTFRNANRDYGTRYNNRQRDLLADARRSSSDGGARITSAEARRILNAPDLRDLRGRWDDSYGKLKTICKDDKPQVIINNPPAEVSNSTTPTTIVQTPPPIVVTNPQLDTVPRGSADTGDGSTDIG